MPSIATPKICTSCNTEKTTTDFHKRKASPDGLQRHCKSCQNTRNASPQMRATLRKWCKQNRERLRLQARKGQRGVKRRKYERDYYARRASVLRARAASYRNADPVKAREYQAQWSASHYAKIKAYKCNRYAKRHGAVGRVTGQQIFDKFSYHGWRCYLCKIPLRFEQCISEHRTPLSRGGSNWIANIAPACNLCNNRKKRRTESEFIASVVAGYATNIDAAGNAAAP